MRKDRTPNQETFDRLLAWLDPDREKAGQRYEHIRAALIKIFTCRRCLPPEDLADETIDRVANRVSDLAGIYVGDPARYFYAVANRVHLSALSKKRFPSVVSPLPVEEDRETESLCLDQCLEDLPPSDREIIEEYYRFEKRSRIENRKALADRLGIPLNALRIRTHRIRTHLRDCMTRCLREEELK